MTPALKRKPPADTKADQMTKRLHSIAERERWPSVRVGEAALPLPAAMLPADLPPLPEISFPPPEETEVARAAVKDLSARHGAFEEDLAAAYAAGDADRVLALRREREEVLVRLWVTQRVVVEAELRHYAVEEARIAALVPRFADALDAKRAEIRRLQDEEGHVAAALAHVMALLQRVGTMSGRLERDLDKLHRGPAALAAAGKEGWSS